VCVCVEDERWRYADGRTLVSTKTLCEYKQKQNTWQTQQLVMQNSCAVDTFWLSLYGLFALQIASLWYHGICHVSYSLGSSHTQWWMGEGGGTLWLMNPGIESEISPLLCCLFFPSTRTSCAELNILKREFDSSTLILILGPQRLRLSWIIF
jgi:hypothetical protein